EHAGFGIARHYRQLRVPRRALFAPDGELGRDAIRQRALGIDLNVEQRSRRVELARARGAVAAREIRIAAAASGALRCHGFCSDTQARDGVLARAIEEDETPARFGELFERRCAFRAEAAGVFLWHRSGAMSVLNAVRRLIGNDDRVELRAQTASLYVGV